MHDVLVLGTALHVIEEGSGKPAAGSLSKLLEVDEHVGQLAWM